MTALKIDNGTEDKYKEDDNKIMEKIKNKRKERKLMYDQAMNGQIKVWDIFLKDPDFNQIRKKYTEEFYECYDMGFQYYVNGEWEEARREFKRAESILSEEKDGPIQNILKFMQSKNFKVPDNWEGIRDDSHDH